MPEEFKKVNLIGTDTGIPIGCIVFYAGDASVNTFIQENPKWLLCNGQSLQKTLYSDLYSVIGDTYSAEDAGENYFNVPNLAGKTLVGVDNDKQLTLGLRHRGVLPVPTGVNPSLFTPQANYFIAGQSIHVGDVYGYTSRAAGVFDNYAQSVYGTSGNSDQNRKDHIIRFDPSKLFGKINGEGSLFNSSVDGIIPSCIVCYPIIKAMR